MPVRRASGYAASEACWIRFADDSATRELMLEFYAGLWSERLAPPQALARAKSKLRERRAPARDWAGWTLSSL